MHMIPLFLAKVLTIKNASLVYLFLLDLDLGSGWAIPKLTIKKSIFSVFIQTFLLELCPMCKIYIDKLYFSQTLAGPGCVCDPAPQSRRIENTEDCCLL